METLGQHRCLDNYKVYAMIQIKICIQWEWNCMCDVKKYNDIYKEIITLQPEDTMQLVLEAETEEEKDFYELVGDYLLQKKQKKVMEGNLF